MSANGRFQLSDWPMGGVPGENIDIWLTDRARLCYCFSELGGRPARRFMGPKTALTIRAKRNGGQVIENTQFREMGHFVRPMISMAYDRGAKRFVSLGEMRPVDFVGFPPRRGPNRRDREIDAGFWGRAADVAVLCDS
jgi:hypothetical protein